MNRLLSKLISRHVFEESQPDDIPIIRSRCAPWKTDKQLDEVVGGLQMDTAELAVKMSYEARAVNWRSEGLPQADITNSLISPTERYERMQRFKICKSNARLRAELQQIFAGLHCSYDLNQQICTCASLKARRP